MVFGLRWRAVISDEFVVRVTVRIFAWFVLTAHPLTVPPRYYGSALMPATIKSGISEGVL